MGGLVARYALTFMETDDYQDGYVTYNNLPFVPISPVIPLPTEPCKPELMHKTRLFMTFDTPHQGANIPLAYQELYKVIANGVFGGFGFSPITRYLVTDWANVFLGAKAAQQMLIYHADIKQGFSTTADEWYYYPHPAKENFFNDLASIGNYPRYCKLMALSNGSLTGNGQTRPYNGAMRTANDILLQFNGDIYARILHFIQIPVFGLNLDMRTNPNGYGKVLGLSAGTWGIKIKLYWFGMKVNVGLNSLVYKDIWAGNTKPWCTEAGGLISIKWYPGSTAQSNQSANAWYWLFGLNWKSQGDGNGHYSFDGSIGIPFVAQAGVQFDIYTDGMHFNFIPTASALDWGNLNSNSPLSLNLQTMTWPQKMNSTPFDVISGIHSSNPNDFEWPNGHYDFNRHHLNVENQRMASWQRLENCNNLVYVLNREIGDAHLWLNNRTLPWKSRFESELDITVNAGNNNPHYEYATGGPQAPTGFGGFYSKSNSFLALNLNPITGQPFEVTFKHGQTFTPNHPPIEPPTEVNILNEPLWICCIPWNQYKTSNNEPTLLGSVEDQVKLMVNPNPFSDRLLVNIELQKEQIVKLDLYNSIGVLIWSTTQFLKIGDNSFEIPTDVTQSGLYILRIHSENNEINENIKLIRE
jgi:hypothetical protein